MSERDNKPKTDAPDLEDARAATDDEAAEAARLRDALEGKGSFVTSSQDTADLAFALRAAWSPESLADDTHAAILDDVPTSTEEMGAAAALATALGTKDEPEIVTALRAAWRPSELPASEHEALIRGAIPASPVGRYRERKLVRFRSVRRIATVVTTTLAAAAAITVWFSSAPPEVPLARARSTAPLFDQPFGDGDGSARIDRIAVARAADYRDNRFAQWGLR